MRAPIPIGFLASNSQPHRRLGSIRPSRPVVFRPCGWVDAVRIPARQTVELKPNGFHVMFTGLSQPLRVGDYVSGTLIFEAAGRVPVEFRVEPIGAMGPSPE